MMARSYEMDMCSGPLLRKLLVFALPLMCSGVLQLLFNAADIVVVGRFTGSTAMAAVGSTTSLINLMVNLFIGLSVGANVVIARSYGAGDVAAVHRGVHTAVLAAGACGFVMIFVGLALSRPMLEWMGHPARCDRPGRRLSAHLLHRHARPSFFTISARPSCAPSATRAARCISSPLRALSMWC